MESIQNRVHSMADTAITGRNSCMVHSTAACKVTYMSVCFSAVSTTAVRFYHMVHSTVVCLPYDPLRCMPLNAICMSAVESIPHSTVLISVEGSTQPIYLYRLLYGPTSLQLFTELWIPLWNEFHSCMCLAC